ncbi:MAG: carboxypeptidase regulatory-like domain-containing protein, partial [Thermoplasmata archaeon]|nr:carboxypeptidase regulatory-like domain-containing protein [Thermoplasmata archaeon]
MAILLVIAMVMGMMGSLLPNVTAGDPNITGTVISATSPFEPIQGVTVTYVGDDGNTSFDITNSAGEFSIFVFSGNTSVDFNLTFDATEDGYELRTDRFNTSYYDGDVADVGTTSLQSLPKIYGVIEEEGTGMPIADVEVTIQKGTEVYEKQTGASGTFSQYVEDGLWNLTYYKDGYYYQEELSVQITGTDKNMGTISLEKITPEPTVEVWGYVHEKDGGPIDGAKVSISTGDDKWITSKTDANGSYSMSAYPGTFQIKAMKDGYETNLSEEWLVVPSDATAVWRDIDLPKIPAEIYTISGKVTDGAIALEDALVTLHRTDGKYQNNTETNASGGFTFMYSGTFRVVVEMDGYFTEVWPFTIDNDNTTDVLGDIELTLIDNNKTVSGFIGDLEEQSPIAGADVTLYDRNQLYTLTTTSGANGHYEFDVYYESNFVLLVDAEGYQAEAIDIPDVTGDVNEPVWLTASPKDIITTKYTFADWSTISVLEKTILVVDNVSERVNADRRWGMGGVLGLSLNNWIVDEPGETDDWAEYLKQKELETKDTAKFLSLDNVYYELDDDVDLVVTVEEAAGDILTSTGAINITKRFNYTIITTPAAADA